VVIKIEKVGLLMPRRFTHGFRQAFKLYELIKFPNDHH